MCELICGKTLAVDGDKKRSVFGASEKLVTRLVAIPDIVANQLNVQERYTARQGFLVIVNSIVALLLTLCM